MKTKGGHTMNKHDRMYQQIENHGANLNAIFNTGLDNVKLAKNLHRLEVKAHKLATDYCNGENGVTWENWDEKCEPILKAVRKVLNMTDTYRQNAIPIFINGDCRGYALKIDSDFMHGYLTHGGKLYTDWGGYGILAPEFDGRA
jgi:hypothetical protein